MGVPPPTHYDVLGVEPEVSHDELRAAYKDAARRAHPDRGGSHAAMRAVNAAWEVLSDPQSRRRYDEEIGVASTAAGGEGGQAGGPHDGDEGAQADEGTHAGGAGEDAQAGGSREDAAGGGDAKAGAAGGHARWEEALPLFPVSGSRLVATAQAVRWSAQGAFSTAAGFVLPFWKVWALLMVFTSPVSILTGLFGVGGLGHHVVWGGVAFGLLVAVPAVAAAVILGVSAGVSVGAAHLLSWLRGQDKHDAEAVWIMIGSYTTDGPRYRWPGGW